jgi:hypothetical protein
VNGIKLGKAKKGGYSKFRYLQFNNFAISTLFRAKLNAIRLSRDFDKGVPVRDHSRYEQNSCTGGFVKLLTLLPDP